MALSLPIQLAGNTECEAVADALYRLMHAFDNNDEEMLQSALAEDVRAEMPGLATTGIAELKAGVFDHLSKLETAHYLSNTRVSIDGPAAARASCAALAQHCRRGKAVAAGRDDKYMAGGTYLFELVKVGDLWKVSSWKAAIAWTDGDEAVVAGQ